jgi:hypothetical protein
MAQPYVVHGLIGNSGESSKVKFYLPLITAANYDDQTGNGIGEAVGELRLAVAAATLMNFTRHTVVSDVYDETGLLPSDANAQREQKLLITYIGDGGSSKKFRIELPGVDRTLFAQTGTDVVDHTSNVNAIALKGVIETYAVTPEGFPALVVAMRLVGRNI